MAFSINFTCPRSRGQATTLGIVDFPNGYMSSQSAKEEAVLQSLGFSGNVNSDYANSMDDTR